MSGSGLSMKGWAVRALKRVAALVLVSLLTLVAFALPAYPRQPRQPDRRAGFRDPPTVAHLSSHRRRRHRRRRQGSTGGRGTPQLARNRCGAPWPLRDARPLSIG